MIGSRFQKFRDRSRNRNGSVLVLAAVFLVGVFALSAFTIDLGYVVIVKQELQNAVDASVLAAAAELKIAPNDGIQGVRDAAYDVAFANDVNGNRLRLNRNRDVEVGHWDAATETFTPTDPSDLSLANAVRVTAWLSDDPNAAGVGGSGNEKGGGVTEGEEPNGSVNLFFAPVIGQSSVDLNRVAIAVIGDGKPRDVLMVIDCSGSMASNNRMTYTRPAATQLADELGEDDRLGLVVYSYPVPIMAFAPGPVPVVFANIVPTDPNDAVAARRGRSNGRNSSAGRNSSRGSNNGRSGGSARSGGGSNGRGTGVSNGRRNTNGRSGSGSSRSGSSAGNGRNGGSRGGGARNRGNNGRGSGSGSNRQGGSTRNGNNRGGNNGGGNGRSGNNGGRHGGNNGGGRSGNNGGGRGGNGGNNGGGGSNGAGNNGGGNGTRLTGFLERPLNLDHQPVKDRIPQLVPSMYASTTNIAGGMRVAIDEFIANPRVDALGQPVQQIMVLMTDGHANVAEPPVNDPVQGISYYANTAHQAGIIIHGITLGSGANQNPIRNAATATGGEFHHVNDGDFQGLFEVYRGIGRGNGNPRLVR